MKRREFIQTVPAALIVPGLILPRRVWAQSTKLIDKQQVALTTANPIYLSQEFPVSSLTEQLNAVLSQATGLASVRDRLILNVGGKSYVATSSLTGQLTDSRFSYTLPMGVRAKALGYMRENKPKRDGFYDRVPLTRVSEEGEAPTAQIELTLVSGSSSDLTIVEFNTVEAPAPTARVKNSVTFDAASSAAADSGATSISWSHSVGTGSDRAIWGFTGYTNSAITVTSFNIAGPGNLTEQFNPVAVTASKQLSGYTGVAPTSGSQTVTVNYSGAANDRIAGVITMDGVDQGDPVGTVVTADGGGGTATVTVASPASDSLICDAVASDGFGSPFPAVGPNQTERTSDDASWNAIRVASSTQSGADGGEMSWTVQPTAWGQGAIEFKAAGAGPPPSGVPPWVRIVEVID